jgi:hypothetical protein
MQTYPLMNIRFPESKEADLVDAMRSRAILPWRWQQHDAHGRPPNEDKFYFHRDEVSTDPPCTLCILREGPGTFIVVNIVPDADGVQISIDLYVRILREFDTLIAEPATDGLGGITSIDTDKRTLEDYFSAEAIRLLELFCKTSNAGDFGAHPSDQEKWMAFLIHVYRTNPEVHCDIFGACLMAKKWWPVDHIPALVREFDSSMRLLRQSGIEKE